MILFKIRLVLRNIGTQPLLGTSQLFHGLNRLFPCRFIRINVNPGIAKPDLNEIVPGLIGGYTRLFPASAKIGFHIDAFGIK